ncbi:hypothetical protein HNQ36_004270 [Afipia massiliensis]|uniref:Uncharacterized protein n=1 Tax=Afipia massiliensis TaxID=211460 RepID=A0A840N8X7_9BRAD|nr:hypothetical protein [Afipia massiliensis]MBB5054268.1 hypothetical protein [Afipia massiliensis]
MHNMPPSLAIALRLTGAIWIFGVVAMLMQADTRVVIAVFIVGLVTAVAEWIAAGKNPPPADAADDDANYA